MAEPGGLDKFSIMCAKCGINLEIGRVTLSYMGSSFPVDLYRCPQCSLVFIPEDLATGKMDKVEKALEDK